ncbi:MAG: DUF6361 family protein [Gemmatimonadales bacterium]
MASTIAWLDHSEHDRRRAVEVIKLFEEKGTVDELGIGVVRDAISDLLFPGTSVLHTRARYFLIIPWIYQYLEGRETPSAEIEGRGRQLELSLIDLLLASDDSQGTIGRVAGKKLKILPSTMYWTGLEAWGIRLLPGTQYQYRRSLDRIYRMAAAGTVRNDDNEPSSAAPRVWHASLPKPPSGFRKEPLSFALTVEEAEYLHERIMTKCRGSLLAHLVDQCRPAPDAPMVWAHPQSGGFPAVLKEQLAHAMNFSLAMHGAALLYNLMLAEAKGDQEDLVAGYRSDLDAWLAELEAANATLHRWNRLEFWATVMRAGGRVTQPTRWFVDAWLDLALGPNSAEDTNGRQARRLVADRELRLKGRLARLHNPMALKQWRGASGLTRMSYRWDPQMRQVTGDIQRGLGRHA